MDGESTIRQIEDHRQFLRVLAESQIGRSMRRKLDADDILQEVLQRAYAGFDEMRSPDNAQAVKSWLLTILTNVMHDHLRRYSSEKREIDREQSVGAELQNSSENLQSMFAAEQTSPSMAAARNEDYLRLSNGLSQLPDEMREVIVLKHLKGMSVIEIAGITSRSPASVAGLLRRGLAKLRNDLM